MDEHIERIKARTLAAENSLIAEHGWTEEEYERVMELAAGNDEASRARLRSFVERRASITTQRQCGRS